MIAEKSHTNHYGAETIIQQRESNDDVKMRKSVRQGCYFGVRLRAIFFVTPRTAIITVGSLGLDSPVRVMTPGFGLGLGFQTHN